MNIDGVSALDRFLNPDPNKCPVCGAHKFAHQEYCDGCKEHKNAAENLRRARARRRAFGDIWS